jgi:hypothetical protein
MSTRAISRIADRRRKPTSGNILMTLMLERTSFNRRQPGAGKAGSFPDTLSLDEPA